MKESPLFVAFGIFFICFLYNLYFLPYGINMLGEGYPVSVAENFMEGKIPYKDVILWGHAPGQFYLLGFFMNAFGFNLVVERIYYILVGSLLAVIVFLIAKKITGKFYPSLLAVFLYTFFLGLKTERLFFPFLTLLVVLNYDLLSSKKEDKMVWILIGLLSGLSLIISQEYAASLIAALFLTLLLSLFSKKVHMKELFIKSAFFIAGFLAVVLPIIYFFYKNNVLQDFFYYMFYYPIKVFPKTQGSSFRLLSDLQSYLSSPSIYNLYKLVSYSLIVYFFMALVMIVYLATIIKAREDSYRENLLFIAFFGIFTFIRPIVRAEMPDILQTAIPAVILFSFLSYGLYTSIKAARYKRIAVAVIIVVSIMLFLYGQIMVGPMVFAEESNFFILLNKNNYEPLNLERANGIYVSHELFGWNFVKSDYIGKKPTADIITKVVNFVVDNSKKNDTIFVVPYESIFYFLTDRENPTKYNHFPPNHLDEKDQLEVIKTLEEKRPKFIIYGHGWQMKDTPVETNLPLLHNYIKTDCTLKQTFGIYEIYSCFD